LAATMVALELSEERDNGLNLPQGRNPKFFGGRDFNIECLLGFRS